MKLLGTHYYHNIILDTQCEVLGIAKCINDYIVY